MIFLSKFLPLFIYPLGLSILLVLAALLLWKKHKIAKTLVILSLIITFVGGNRYVANSLARSLEWQYSTPIDAPAPDLIVVLGGATEPMIEPRPMTELNAAGDRVLYAYALHLQYPDARLLLSGGNVEFLAQGDSTPASEMSALLILLGVPQQLLILEDESRNTFEDALKSCQLISIGGYQNVWLVTSAMHMPRSVKLFEKQGCPVTPAPTDFTITTTAWQQTWHPRTGEFFLNLIPSYSNLSQVSKVMKEYLGMIYYRFSGKT